MSCQFFTPMHICIKNVDVMPVELGTVHKLTKHNCICVIWEQTMVKQQPVNHYRVNQHMQQSPCSNRSMNQCTEYLTTFKM